MHVATPKSLNLETGQRPLISLNPLGGRNMYTSFEVSNFRGFKKLRMSSLSRVNLITGMNNVGKTALLEALFVHSGGHNPDLTMVINGLRGLTNVGVDFERVDRSPWDSIFFNFDSTNVIQLNGTLGSDFLDVRFKFIQDPTEISGLRLSIRTEFERSASMADRVAAKILRMEVRREKDFQSRKSRSAKFDPDKLKPIKYFLILDRTGKKVEPTPPVAPFPSKLNVGRARESAEHEARRFGQLQIDGKDEVLLRALQILDPRLHGLSVVFEAGEPLLQGDIGLKKRHLIPLLVMGDGMNRLASIIMLIGSTANGALMLDEVDTGFHYSLLPKVWGAIYQAAADFNVQLFCTTHSRECVAAAHAAAVDRGKYELSLHRLERRDTEISVISYDHEAIESSLSSEFEVR